MEQGGHAGLYTCQMLPSSNCKQKHNSVMDTDVSLPKFSFEGSSLELPNR